MEQALLENINAAADKKYGGSVPPEMQARIAVETGHILDNGSCTLLAAVADMAEFSAAHGYSVGFRGLIGNLLISHLCGIGVNDPMEMGLPWEGCLGLDGGRTPEIFLNVNVADEAYKDLREYLSAILPECDVHFGIGEYDALHIMRCVGGGGFNRLTPKYRDMLAAHGICGLPWNTLRETTYLFPRGMCADYLHWALTLLALEHRACRA